jgi:dTDP-4-amino-4,6-dideoxygalactose transaminase
MMSSSTQSQALALLGGESAIRTPIEENWPAFTEADALAVAQMVRLGEVSYIAREGAVLRLEEAMQARTHARHALAINSGTSALLSAFFGLQIGSGDEVIVPTYTHHATVMPLFVLNAIPVLADAEPETGNIDPKSVERMITARTKAIVVMHLNGFAVDMPGVMDIARKHKLKVIEDCSQAHGAECCGSPVGSFGDVAAFSLQSRKQVVAGAGGVLTTNDRRTFDRALMLGHSLARAEQDVASEDFRQFATTGFGLNLRMHPLAASLATSSLSRLDSVLATRQANCDRLDAIVDQIPGLQKPVVRDHVTRIAPYSYQPLYDPEQLGGLPIETFVMAVAAEGVPIARPRTPPLHQAAAFQDPTWLRAAFRAPARAKRHLYRDGDLPNSEKYFKSALRMPVFSRDVRSDIEHFSVAFEKVVRSADMLRDLYAEGLPEVLPHTDWKVHYR